MTTSKRKLSAAMIVGLRAALECRNVHDAIHDMPMPREASKWWSRRRQASSSISGLVSRGLLLEAGFTHRFEYVITPAGVAALREIDNG